MNPIRRVPAILLLVVLALLPVQALLDIGAQRVVIDDASRGLDAVVWTATIAPTGRIAVRIDYDLDGDDDMELSIRVPDGARYATLDGAPLALDNASYATVTVRDRAVVAYELTGRVTRYGDGAVLQLASLRPPDSSTTPTLDGDEGLFPCTWCYIDGVEFGQVPVHGALRIDGTDTGAIDPRFEGLGDVRTAAEPGLLRFVGVAGSSGDTGLVALLPAGAVPDAPLSPDRIDAADAFADVVDALETSGEDFRSPAAGSVRGWATFAVLVVILAGLAAWILRRLAAARRDRLAARDDRPVLTGVDGVFSKPSDLEPALVGMVVGTAGAGDRSVVAGALLSLAHRGVISIDGVDSNRYTLTIPAGARGDTVFEEAVLARLRPQGQVSASATLTGPPLWGDDGDRIAARLASVLAKEAIKAGLVRTTLSGFVLVPVAVAMGAISIVGSRGISGLGWFAVCAGPLLAVVAAIATGVTLTGRGREERRRWSEYADWLRDQTELHRVGAPGVHTWGEVLPHAAVLGAAPLAASALSPRHGGPAS